MKINFILGLGLVGLSMIALTVNSFITADLQVVFSSSVEERSENQQQGNAHDNGNGASAEAGGGDDANDNGNGASAEAGGGGDDANDNNDSNQELTDAINPSPTDEALTEEQQQEQRELTMEIINSNDLIPVNDTSSIDKI